MRRGCHRVKVIPAGLEQPFSMAFSKPVFCSPWGAFRQLSNKAWKLMLPMVRFWSLKWNLSGIKPQVSIFSSGYTEKNVIPS